MRKGKGVPSPPRADGGFISGKQIAVDLFSGAGGMSEGLRRAGYRIAGAVEVDKLACQTYRLNHRGVELWNIDIRRLSGASMLRRLRLKRGDIDLLAACPPCQGFSVMRTRNGAQRNNDPRNDLIFEVLRFARALRPKAIMLENVPRLVENRRYSLFRKGLEALGYHLVSGVLNVVDFAVPQSRRRLVLLGSKTFTPHFAPKSRNRRTVRDAIGALPRPTHSDDPLHNYRVRRSRAVMDRIRQIPRNGGSRLSLGVDAQLPCHSRCDGFKDVYGRMAWGNPAPTITGGCINPSKGRYLHPSANRAITLREAALLQTFPRSYRFPIECGRYPVALLIGNALPPEFIRRHALALRRKGRILDESPDSRKV